jgi:dynactin complex subunit
MVNFDCLSVGLEVEFQIEKNLLQTGVVRYKGPINGQEGDWVGVEANQAVGSSDGRLGGRVYFKCPDKHGLFLSPHQLRLSRKKSAARKLYKSVDSYCDDLLFKS